MNSVDCGVIAFEFIDDMSVLVLFSENLKDMLKVLMI